MKSGRNAKPIVPTTASPIPISLKVESPVESAVFCKDPRDACGPGEDARPGAVANAHMARLPCRAGIGKGLC